MNLSQIANYNNIQIYSKFLVAVFSNLLQFS